MQVTSIIGFGATDSAWNARHIPDSDFAPGAAYNPDPNLPKVNGHTGVRYGAVRHSNGRVLGYNLNFMPNTTIDAAKAAALQEFPPDVTTVWFSVKDTCAQLEIKSVTLGSALRDPSVDDAAGMAIVEFDTERADGSAGYDAKNINEAIVGLGSYNSPIDAPAC